jgi:hypothetical protein
MTIREIIQEASDIDLANELENALKQSETRKSESKSIEPKINKDIGDKELYIRAKITLFGKDVIPPSLQGLPKKTWKIPEQAKECEKELIDGFKKAESSGSLYDESNTHPKIVIAVSEKIGDQYKRVFTGEATNTLGIKKIFESKFGKETTEALPGNTTATIDIYFKDINEDQGKNYFFDSDKEKLAKRQEARKTYKDIYIAKNVPVKANYTDFNNTFKELRRKILFAYNKLIKSFMPKGLTIDSSEYKKAFYEIKKDIDDTGGIYIDLFLNGKKEETIPAGVYNLNKGGSMEYFGGFKKLYKILSDLHDGGIIKESIYFNY